MSERVRFSPAPAGSLHLGRARTALFDWLVARHELGAFILRVEDPECRDPMAEASVMQDLAWLGLDCDEGPEAGGPHAPYRQSERRGLYERTLLELRATGAVYPCFCPPGAPDEPRDEDAGTGGRPRHRCGCAGLPPDEAGERLVAGEEAEWRFAVPRDRAVEWADRVHGRISFRSEEIGDFAIADREGAPLRDLACVADDAAMRITLVIRGDDRIPDTPRQILLFEALGRTPPRYAHLPLVTGPDGTPLSGSEGEAVIGELREKGYLPDAVIDHLSRLGWSDPIDRPALTREELIAAFDLARVSPAPARHDPARLRALNARHMRSLPPDRLAAVLAPHLPALPGWLDPVAFAEAVRGEIEVASDALPFAEGLIAPPPPDEEAERTLEDEEGAAAVAAAAEVLRGEGRFDVDAASRALTDALGDADPRRSLRAVRAALTGRAEGLPLRVLLGLLGRGRSLERLVRAGN